MASLVYLKDLPGYMQPEQPAKPTAPEPKPLCKGLATAEVPVEPIRPCKQCKGDGYLLSEGYKFTGDDGIEKVRPSQWKRCFDCDGAGWFHAPDLEAIVKAVQGRKPCTLRSKRPDDAVPYFVWRMARFHSGKDVCMPMGATMELGGNPYMELLDELARIIAERWFGSGNVGRARWQQAMYGSHSFQDLPQHLDGPTYDADKPVEEMLETI
jgi:hypothetical protein